MTFFHEAAGRNRHACSLLIWICLAGGLTACATGRTEFKVVKNVPADMPAAETQASQEAVLSAQANTPAAQAASASPAVETWTYTVLPGESLWRISRRLLGDPRHYREIARANALTEPNLIQPGQQLKLDRAWAKSAPPVPAPPAVTPAPMAKSAAPAGPAYPSRPNQAFKPGEHLMFAVQYFNIAAGFAALDVETGPKKNGRATYHIVATARTHPAFEWIFKVRDRIESYVDAQGIFSWQYEKHLREGGYSNDSVIIYDQLNQKVIKDEGRTIIPAPPWVQDVLSEFYFFRTLKFNLGDIVSVPVVADDGKSYELLVTIVKRERISVPAGSFDCIVVEPALKFEGLFQQRGRVAIWLTDDEHHVPVLIKSQIVIGTIDIVLREARVME
jgi:LysM repeat protein